jgi:hypothetical protein
MATVNNPNVLDLGDFHRDVQEFVAAIIEDPERLISPHATHSTGSLDGQGWENPNAIAAVKKLQPDLVHLRSMLVAFFTGALHTWIRFSAEFAPGGLIDEATIDERQSAWMPSTNDANEGALGAFRVQMRKTPRLTAHHYNSLAMYNRNDTQAFMDTILQEIDHVFIRRVAREVDASGLEAKRRKAQVEFDCRRAEIQRQKEADKKRRADEYREKLSKVVLVTDDSQIMSMTVPRLDDQLDVLRHIGGDLAIPASKSARGKKADKQELLKAALSRHIVHLRNVPTTTAGPSQDFGDEMDVSNNWWDEEDEEMEEQ